jgi:hypothetical protein
MDSLFRNRVFQLAIVVVVVFALLLAAYGAYESWKLRSDLDSVKSRLSTLTEIEFEHLLHTANVELLHAQNAIADCMADAGVTSLDCADNTLWDGSSGVVTATNGDTTYDAADYLADGKFVAVYQVMKNGDIVDGSFAGSRWRFLQWDDVNNCWKMKEH